MNIFHLLYPLGCASLHPARRPGDSRDCMKALYGTRSGTPERRPPRREGHRVVQSLVEASERGKARWYGKGQEYGIRKKSVRKKDTN